MDIGIHHDDFLKWMALHLLRLEWHDLSSGCVGGEAGVCFCGSGRLSEGCGREERYEEEGLVEYGEPGQFAKRGELMDRK